MQKIDYTITLDHDLGLYLAEAPDIPNAYTMGATIEAAFRNLMYIIDDYVRSELDKGLHPLDGFMVLQRDDIEILETGDSVLQYFASDFDLTKLDERHANWMADSVATQLGLKPAGLRIKAERYSERLMIRVISTEQFAEFLKKLGHSVSQRIIWEKIEHHEYYHQSRRFKNMYSHAYDTLGVGSYTKQNGTKVYYTLSDNVRTAWQQKRVGETFQDSFNRLLKYDIPIAALQLQKDTEAVLTQMLVTSVGDCINMIGGMRNGIGHVSFEFTADMFHELQQKLIASGHYANEDDV